MIDEISVANIALIDQASIRFAKGLTAITGETGAGKTALLSSLRLIMGQRSDRSAIREGQDEASVSARIYEEGSPDELIIFRSISSDGRSRVKVNGQIESVSELADSIGSTINLSGQHDQQLLTKPALQRQVLDGWASADIDPVKKEYERLFDSCSELEEKLASLEEGAQVSEERLENARFALRQISSLAPSAEDYEEMKHSLAKAENAEALARLSNEAYDALSGENQGLDCLNGAIALLEDAAKYDPLLQPLATNLREAIFLAEDASRDILEYRDAIDLDVSSLEMLQERASAYQSVLRQYGPSVEDVLKKAEEFEDIVKLANNGDAAIAEAKEALSAEREELRACASQLTQARRAAAPGFCDKINEILSSLEMGSATLICEVEQLDEGSWSKAGPDRVEFLFKAASGMQPRPLSRVASGGELSRIMLALHTVMGEADSVSTLVFDEIDAGVGGETAKALAEVLVKLAKTHQVIVVTHLAQIAARANMHYVVSKSEQDGVARTSIEDVMGDARINEIARMLSGTRTDASIKHAKELLSLSSVDQCE